MAEDRIDFIVPVALKEAMERLVPEFERGTGHRFGIAVMLNPEVPGHVAAGAEWDVAITNPRHVDEILEAGLGAPGSHRPFGRSPLAFGVRGVVGNAPCQSADDIRAMLLQVETIAVTETGTSGKAFARLTRTLGIRDELRPKLRLMAGGEPMAALLAGEVAVAALPLTNIALVPGVSVAGICPPELDLHVDLSLCLSRDASAAAREFADWLVDPARDAVLGRLGAERFGLAS